MVCGPFLTLFNSYLNRLIPFCLFLFFLTNLIHEGYSAQSALFVSWLQLSPIYLPKPWPRIPGWQQSEEPQRFPLLVDCCVVCNSLTNIEPRFPSQQDLEKVSLFIWPRRHNMGSDVCRRPLLKDWVIPHPPNLWIQSGSHLVMWICSEKCTVGWFCYCANITECTN